MTNPVVILHEPQMGENIGAVARAMANFGLSRLRLVRPRDGWPNPKAQPMAAGADFVLDGVEVFRDLSEALGDLRLVFATTARSREMLKPSVTPAEAAAQARAFSAPGAVGFLFGSERAGLANDAVAFADAILTIPTSQRFSSLNLAQAVLLCGYEWHRTGDAPIKVTDGPLPATKGELHGFFLQLESALDEGGFLFPKEKRASMVLSLRAMWQRAGLLEQDVRTLRGIVTALSGIRVRASGGSSDD